LDLEHVPRQPEGGQPRQPEQEVCYPGQLERGNCHGREAGEEGFLAPEGRHGEEQSDVREPEEVGRAVMGPVDRDQNAEEGGVKELKPGGETEPCPRTCRPSPPRREARAPRGVPAGRAAMGADPTVTLLAPYFGSSNCPASTFPPVLMPVYVSTRLPLGA